MNKYTIIVLVFLTTVFSETTENFQNLTTNQNNIEFTFEIDDIQLENSSDYTKINSNAKGETGIIGMPKLPKYSTMLILDPKKNYDLEYEIVESYVLNDI